MPGLRVRAVRDAVTARLRRAGVDSPEAEAVWLLEAATGLTRSEQALAAGRELGSGEAQRLEAWLRRREAREPLQLILGSAVFHGLTLEMRRGVLVPRPETERLVELVLAEAPAGGEPWSVVEIGTGSGAVALALAAARSGTRITAGDVDAAAVALARANARALGLEVDVVKSDLLADPALRRAAKGAHAMVANLPYLPASEAAQVPPEVAWDPPGALYAGADGLEVARRLLREAAAVLPQGAPLWLELDERNVHLLEREALGAGWSGSATARDLSGRERFLRLRSPPEADRAAAPRA